MHILILNNAECSIDYSDIENVSLTYLHYKELSTTNLDAYLENVNCILITGGPQHVYDKFPELEYELLLIQKAIQKKIQIIGICLGFQILNHYFGNKVIRLSEPCIGHNFSERTDLLGKAFSFHYDGVIENKHTDILVLHRSIPFAQYNKGIVYEIQHRFLPIYGIQSHPDAGYNEIIQCLKKYNRTSELYDEKLYTIIFQSFFNCFFERKKELG
jgi:anthranilate/para-aminobenzoate synthase component II